MNKLEQAAEALETAADALEEIPSTLRFKSLFGLINNIDNLRAEAKHLYDMAEVIKDVSE